MSEPYWEPFAGSPSGLSYKGDYAGATAYQDGDVVVYNGVTYLCVGGPTSLPPDPAPWGTAGLALSQVGDELAYAEIVGNLTGTQTTDATAGTVLTLPTITLDGATPIVIDVAIPLIQHSALSYVIVSLWDGAAQVGRIGSIYAPSAGNGESFYERLRLTPAAGTHSYTIRVHGGSAGTWTVVAGGGGAGNYLVASARISRVYPMPPQFGVGALTPVTYGITLPASPSDGQEAILVDSLVNPTYQWRFRYNAGSTSPYKWEFIGGTDALRTVAADQTTATNNSWVNLATVGPDFVTPYAGDWEVFMQGQAYGVATSMYLGVALGDTTPVVSTSLLASASVQASIPAGKGPLTGVPAGSTLRMRYFMVAAGTGHWSARTMLIHPLRVG